MRENGIGQYKSIDEFVEAKLESYNGMEKNFCSLFELMFRERNNIMYERSEGYKIIKTTYGEVYESILKKAAYLADQTGDLTYNSVIGLYMDNGIEWIESFWAIIICGFRPLLMNMRLPESLLKQALSDCDARVVISLSKEFGARRINGLVAKDEPFTPKRYGTEILVMSSGTSESVKLCAFSAEEVYYQICDSLAIIKECSQIKKHYDGNLKLLTFLPFYHIFGLVAVYIWFAFFSRTFVQLNDLTAETIQNTIKRHKVTHVFAVPLFWEKVYAGVIKTVEGRGRKTAAKFNKALRISEKIGDLPVLGGLFSRLAYKEVRENLFGESIRFMISGGSMIGTEILGLFNAIGYRLVNGYGMSEVGITSVELSDKQSIINAGYVGKPLSSVEYKIDETGELFIKGRTLAKHIIENGEIRNNDGWFRTRDLAECENGHYKIIGRKDDIIILADGENLNPNLIEPSLMLPGINGVCIIGSGEGRQRQSVLLVSVNRYMPKQAYKEIDTRLKERLRELDIASRISRIVYIGEPIIKGDEFKLNRLRLARDYAEERLAIIDLSGEAEAEINSDELMEQIRRMVGVAVAKDTAEIGIDSDFFIDCGGSSLDFFALITRLGEEFSVSFPAAASECPSTVRGMYEYIKAEIKSDDQVLQ